MKKKLVVSILTLITLLGIENIVRADDYIVGLYENILNGYLVNMIWVGIVIIISIIGIIALNKLRKKERISIVLYRVLVIILAIVLVGLIIYEGTVIWDYAGVKPAYDYLTRN